MRVLRLLLIFFFAPVLFAGVAAPGQAATVSLPLTVDYPLLTALYRRAFFPAGANTLALADQRDGCNYLYLSDPRFTADGGYLRLNLRVTARIGAAVGNQCLASVPWRGQILLLLRPQLDERTFALTFSVADSVLLTPDGRPDRMVGTLWNFVSPLIFRHAGEIAFDLAPPVQQLRDFLPSLFPFQSQEQLRRMLDSLAGQAVVATANGLAVSLRIDVPARRAPVSGGAPSDAELERAVRLWEKWDSLLLRMLAVFDPHLLSAEDKELLSAILLDTRYAFVAALDDRQVGEDFVRRQFLAAWQRMAPIFRRRLAAEPGDNPWSYLSFLTAADALKACDALGPALGVEISEQGLVRLARMLGGKELNYSTNVQPFLRDLMTLPEAPPQPASSVPETDLPPLNDFTEGDLPPEKLSNPDEVKPETAPSVASPEERPADPAVETPTAPPEEEPDIPAPLPERLEQPSTEPSTETPAAKPEEEADIPAPLPEPPAATPPKPSTAPSSHQGGEGDIPHDRQSGWWPRAQRTLIGLAESFCPAVIAATLPEPWRHEDVLAWKTPPADATGYLRKMLGILTATAKKQRGFSKLANPPDFLTAMAWQESCFRQFIPFQGRMTFVLSSNRTSVGLMQVNERVWRGIYDQERLRWDMPYNAAAGAEIAALYLRQAQKKSGRLPAGEDMLETAVYAMYNGGPGQLDKFIRRAQNGNLYKTDRLFREKLRWTKAQAWNMATRCLGNG